MYKYRHYVLFWSLDPCFGKNYFTRNLGVFQNSMAWCSKGKALWTWKCKTLLPSPLQSLTVSMDAKAPWTLIKTTNSSTDLQGRWPHTGWSRTWKHQWGMQTWNYTLGPKATESVCTFQCATKRGVVGSPSGATILLYWSARAYCVFSYAQTLRTQNSWHKIR